MAELDGVVYQAGNRFYVQGVRTKVRRSGYDVYDIPVLKDIGGSAESSGCYTVVAGTPQQTVYHEFRMRYPWKKPFAVSGYALYAYPLAGVLWLGLGVPATVLSHFPCVPLLPWMYPVR